jgi:Fe2+ transport system protein FeoA
MEVKMSVKLLSKLVCGEKGRIVKIRGEAAMHRLLFELGLVVGRTISVEKTSMTLLEDPIEVRVKARVLSLERDVAANIQVEVA